MTLLTPLRAGRKMASLDPTQIDGMIYLANTLSFYNLSGTFLNALNSANLLSGTIPKIFATLGSLRYFDAGATTTPTSSDVARKLFSLNNISGTLPSFEFANLSDSAHFSANPISGVMPDTMRHGSVTEFYCTQYKKLHSER